MSNLIESLVTSLLSSLIHSIKNNIPLFCLALFSCSLQAASPSPVPVVVISQIIQHVSLDQEREGLIAALKEGGYGDGKTMILIYKNAQGSLATASEIANNFAGRSPTVAVAISTPSAQTLLKLTQQVPLVFTAVTDPIGAKIVSSLGQRPENVTGVSDALPIRPQLALIKQILPDLKNLGIIYNPGEMNSVKAVQQLQEEALPMRLTLVLATADKSSAIVPATMQLLGKEVDAIFIPNDNTAVAAIESIVSIGKKFKLPIFAGDAGSVERGAIASQAFDRHTLGRKVGALIVKILQGEKAGDLPVETDHPLVLMINLKSAEDMGVAIPEDLKKNAQIVGDVS